MGGSCDYAEPDSREDVRVVALSRQVLLAVVLYRGEGGTRCEYAATLAIKTLEINKWPIKDVVLGYAVFSLKE